MDETTQAPLDDEAEITAGATVRYAEFLGRELEILPTAHPLHRRYSDQLRLLGDRPVPGVPASSHL
jgi:hypothetical protein